MRNVSVCALTVFLAVASAAVADERSVSLSVRADRVFGGEPGRLVIDEGGLAFEAREASQSRRWSSDDIRALEVPSPSRVVVQTYERAGRLPLRRGTRAYVFDAAEGSVPPQFVAAVLARLPHPVMTTVLPPARDAMWSGPVWHARRGGGDNGVLELNADSLIFRSGTAKANRYWRFRDIASVLRLDGNRLEVAVRESTDLKSYLFELKAEMPDAIFDKLWTSLHEAGTWVRELAPRTEAAVP